MALFTGPSSGEDLARSQVISGLFPFVPGASFPAFAPGILPSHDTYTSLYVVPALHDVRPSLDAKKSAV